MTVPNGALRWKPRPEMVAPEYRSLIAGDKGQKHGSDQSTKPAGAPATAVKTSAEANAKPVDPKVAAALQHAKQHGGIDPNAGKQEKPQPAAAAPAKPKNRAEHGQVWVKDGLTAKPIRVRVGVTDGSNTEISGPGIEEGTKVIIGEMSPEEAAGDMSNPFIPPKFFKRAGGPPKTRP